MRSGAFRSSLCATLSLCGSQGWMPVAEFRMTFRRRRKDDRLGFPP
jgi:hypothetical protein